MLRTSVREAYEHGRIVVFIEPIALYMFKDLHIAKDSKWSFKYPNPKEEISLGEFGEYGEGKKLIIISYGNGLYLSLQAKKEIEEKINNKIKVIDLRWLSEINVNKLLDSFGNCRKILIVDECRRNGCHAEGLMSELLGETKKSLNIRFHAAENSFIPIGKASTVTLPSKESIIKNSLELINE